MTRVVYIMGPARSGSTLLGVLLENCEGFFYAGELDAWLRNCGKPSYVRPSTVAFWGRIEQQLVNYRGLCGDLCLRKIEHSTACLRPSYAWRARKLRPAYRDFNRELFVALSELAESDTIVDSSHYPLRARELRRIGGLDVSVVFLTRDARAIIASFHRTPGEGAKGFLAANAYLWWTHLLSVIVFLSHPCNRRLVVRYSDLTTNPAAVGERVLRMVGSDSPAPLTRELNTGRPLAGNRILRDAYVHLEERPRTESGRWAMLTAFLQSPWTLAVHILARESKK
jgi:hypothetical protein